MCKKSFSSVLSVDLGVSALLRVVDPVLELPLGVGLQPPDVVHGHAEPLVRPAPDVLGPNSIENS